MSFLKRLFGLGPQASPADGGSAAAREVEYKGFIIQATPFQESGQHQTCGVISKEIGGERKEHRFIRADRFASHDDAVEVSIRKGQQMIDEQGEKIFG
jgi:hypothetical protein